MTNFNLIIVTFFFMSSSLIFGASKPDANMVKSAIDEWMIKAKSSHEQIPDSEVLDSLAKTIIQKIPDAQSRMEALLDYAAFGGEGAPYTVRMVWSKIASPTARAAFLNHALQTSSIDTIGYISTFTENDLVDAEIALANPNLAGATELDREDVYLGKYFTPLFTSKEGASPRLLAIWFSKAPYQAALACLGGNDDEKRLQLRRVNDLRFEIEEGKSDEQKEQVWRKLEHELELMLLSGSPASELYVAGVLRWKRTIYPSLNESDSLVSALGNHRSPIIDCILQGVTNITLINLPSDKSILFSIASPLAQTTPVPQATTTAQQPKSTISIMPSPTTAETMSAPSAFPIVPVAIVGAVILGIVLYLFRRK